MKPLSCAAIAILCLGFVPLLAAEEWPPAIDPILRAVNLNIGESCDLKLSDGSSAAVKLVNLREIRDDLRQAVREAHVTVEVNGQRATLIGYNYHLPTMVGGVQIDCSITKGCVQPKSNPWALEKDARLRLWPAGSPWIRPGTFQYPLHNLRWFSSLTQMANEPVYTDGSENPKDKPGPKDKEVPASEEALTGKKAPAIKSIYYHYGLDSGGAEKLVNILAAADAVVAVKGKDTIKPVKELPSEVKPRYDVVYLLDGRGWYYRYSHLDSIDPAVKVGERVKMGQKIGVLGKEGASGGWSHLHFDIVAPQPSGKFGISDAYAFFWQAYHEQYKPELQAVARPHHLAWAGEDVVLDGSLSWSAQGPKHIAGYQWTLADGRKADGPTTMQRYPYAGEFSEILKVTDADGRVDYDFCVVQILDREHPELLPPAIHATYWPTMNLKVGDEITFKVRSFYHGAPANQPAGGERWNFGDGTPPVEVKCLPVQMEVDGKKQVIHSKDGYAVTTHRYAKPGDYLVSVSCLNTRGQTATARLFVRIAAK